ncbi:hypothetical protein Cgig2_006644 [Carnegiea gigantea]|uniref:Uncharacterized protein n=1 Tax=Carnegiea gigantea TaxID=171969 RepID=A0A9Q1JP36_9CARY|nr:hypothetical protein Cgig2_006644 [Carnegiea gigantea]
MKAIGVSSLATSPKHRFIMYLRLKSYAPSASVQMQMNPLCKHLTIPLDLNRAAFELKNGRFETAMTFCSLVLNSSLLSYGWKLTSMRSTKDTDATCSTMHPTYSAFSSIGATGSMDHIIQFSKGTKIKEIDPSRHLPSTQSTYKMIKQGKKLKFSNKCSMTKIHGCEYLPECESDIRDSEEGIMSRDDTSPRTEVLDFVTTISMAELAPLVTHLGCPEDMSFLYSVQPQSGQNRTRQRRKNSEP